MPKAKKPRVCGEIRIKYHWKRADGKQSKSLETHSEALHERAQEIIFEKIKDGFTSGELIDHVRMTNKDGPDGVPYTGWWEAFTNNNAEEETCVEHPHKVIAGLLAQGYELQPNPKPYHTRLTSRKGEAITLAYSPKGLLKKILFASTKEEFPGTSEVLAILKKSEDLNALW
jgi:hypothetical protein